MLKEYPKFRAAAVQHAPVYHDKPVYFDMPATLANAVKAIKEAASNGASLVVFPELAIPGYCHFALELDRGPEYTGIWAEYLRHGIEVPSEETDILCRAARENKVNVVMGINERVAKYGGRQHNSAVFINKQGEIVHVHRKINITVQELLIHTRGNGGKNLWIPEFDFGKVSALICGEHNQPMLWNNYIIQGAKVNCSMWPGYLGGAEELPWVTPAMTTAVAATGAMWCVLAVGVHPAGEAAHGLLPQHQLLPELRGQRHHQPVRGDRVRAAARRRGHRLRRHRPQSQRDGPGHHQHHRPLQPVGHPEPARAPRRLRAHRADGGDGECRRPWPVRALGRLRRRQRLNGPPTRVPRTSPSCVRRSPSSSGGWPRPQDGRHRSGAAGRSASARRRPQQGACSGSSKTGAAEPKPGGDPQSGGPDRRIRGGPCASLTPTATPSASSGRTEPTSWRAPATARRGPPRRGAPTLPSPTSPCRA